MRSDKARVIPELPQLGNPRRPRADRDHLLHETRKAAKRVRYTAEVAALVLGTRATELVGSMKELQDLLGADSEFSDKLLRDLGLVLQPQFEGSLRLIVGRR